MNLIDNLKIIANNLRGRKAQSFLTILGIIIGIASVIIIMSVGAGAQSLILNQIETMGSNLIGILPGASEEEGPPASVMGIVITTLKYEDGLALAKTNNVPHAVAVASYVRGQANVSWQNQNTDTYYVGTTAGYLTVEDCSVASGRFFNEEEESGLGRVVILGSQVKDDLFGDEDPLDQMIKIKRESFRVIGVMSERGTAAFTNQDNQIFIPISSSQKLLAGIHHVNFIRVKVDAAENMDKSVEDIKMTLRERHNIDSPVNDDFTIRSTAQALEVVSTVTNALSFFLAAIAAISLLVGGIGIMNIMLIAVKERIREIGLRKAVGARSFNIMLQFLTETVFVTLLGGLVGIVSGAVVSALIALGAQYLGYNWDLVISLQSILLAAGVCILIGLVFGLYPARKAAKLNPVEALRYE